jgi:hypothetical protein
MPDDAVNAAQPAAPLVADLLVCLECGYSLRGFRLEARCPECGRSIADSIRGNRLDHCLPRYVRLLQVGAILVELAVAATTISLAAAIFLKWVPLGVRDVSDSLVVVASVLWLPGWWLLTRLNKDFAGPNRARWSRFVMRSSAIIATAGTFLMAVNVIGTFWSNALPRWASVWLAPEPIWLAGSVAGYFASLVYLRWMAPRFPDAILAKRAARLLWLGPLISIAFVVGGLMVFKTSKTQRGETLGDTIMMAGALLAAALYLAVLDRVRRGIGRVRRRRSGTQSAAP